MFFLLVWCKKEVSRLFWANTSKPVDDLSVKIFHIDQKSLIDLSNDRIFRLKIYFRLWQFDQARESYSTKQYSRGNNKQLAVKYWFVLLLFTLRSMFIEVYSCPLISYKRNVETDFSNHFVFVRALMIQIILLLTLFVAGNQAKDVCRFPKSWKT